MNLTSISQRFPDQQACIKYLEEKRWGQQPCCPRCGSQRVARKQEGKCIGRWNCHGCKSSFNVLSGTVFERTMVPLPKWFLAIGLMVNAKKSLSSCQLARDVGLNTKTAWFMHQRIRAGMAAKEASLLKGIVEVAIGSRPSAWAPAWICYVANCWALGWRMFGVDVSSGTVRPGLKRRCILGKETCFALQFPSALAHDWLKPAAVVGGLALLLAAFHGVQQEIHGLRQKLKADIQAVETRVRADLSELRADYRALNEKLDRVLEGLLQP